MRWVLAVVACVVLVQACEWTTQPIYIRGCGENLSYYADRVREVSISTGTVSQVMFVGRVQKPVGSSYHYYIRWVADPDSVVAWCSSDTTVIRVVDGEVRAVSPGAARLYLSDSSGRGDSITVFVTTPAGYSLTFLGAGLGDSTAPVAMNDSGDVLIQTPTGAVIWRDHVVTAVGSCSPNHITNLRHVLCNGLWQNGVTQPLSATAINDSGVYTTFRVFGPAGYYQTVVVDGTDTTFITGMSYATHINNAGRVVGMNTDLAPSISYIVFSGGTGTISGGGGISRSAAIRDLAQRGHAVGGNTCYMSEPLSPWLWDTAGGGRLQNSACYPGHESPGTLRGEALGTNDSLHHVGYVGFAPGLGENPWVGDGAGALWRDRRTILLDAVLADTTWTIGRAVAIDYKGRIAAHGRNKITGQRGAVLLTPP
jgi:hypothetical protein